MKATIITVFVKHIEPWVDWVFLTINFADSHSETELSNWTISRVVYSVVFLSVGVLYTVSTPPSPQKQRIDQE